MISLTWRTLMLLQNWTSEFLILLSSVTCSRNGGMKEPLSIFFPKINKANSKRQLINFYWKCLQSISSSQPQWWLSSPASFDPALQFSLCLLFSTLNPPWPLLTFVGPGLCGFVTPVDWGEKKEEGITKGNHRLWQCACMCVWWECWLAIADATQASAVSSHGIIPLPRSPRVIQRFSATWCD